MEYEDTLAGMLDESSQNNKRLRADNSRLADSLEQAKSEIEFERQEKVKFATEIERLKAEILRLRSILSDHEGQKQNILTRNETVTLVQFRANMYRHAAHAFYDSCWKCGHAFVIDEQVNVCLTRGHGNIVICTDCARSAGLLEKIDERGFVRLDSKK